MCFQNSTLNKHTNKLFVFSKKKQYLTYFQVCMSFTADSSQNSAAKEYLRFYTNENSKL